MAAKKRRRYTDEERASLIVMLQSEGYPTKLGALRKIAKYSGVPERTLQRWWKGDNNPPPDKLVAQKKGSMIDALESVAWKLVGSLDDDDAIADAPLQQRATAYGIVMDKLRLLQGLPTDIVQLVPDVVKAIQDLGQSPAEVFEGIIRRAKQHQDDHASR